MIPDWVEYAKDGAQVASILGGIGLAYVRLVAKLSVQNAVLAEQNKVLAAQNEELRKQSKGLEWNNEVTELVAKQQATIPAPAGSDPPPALPVRPKVASLDEDAFAEVMREARERENTNR